MEIPDDTETDSDSHAGVEFPSFPGPLRPKTADHDNERVLVCDMSSNFLSRKVDVKNYGVGQDPITCSY